MSKIIYPGTFDPITLGHIDLIKKASKIFNQVIVATTDNINKKLFFSLEERVEMIKKSLFKDSNLSKNKIKIVTFDTLTINLCKKYKANVIMRGLRATSDFEYEFQLAGMNKKLNNQIETIFLMSDVEHQIISSNFVREIAVLKGNLNKFLSKSVIKMVKEKYE